MSLNVTHAPFHGQPDTQVSHIRSATLVRVSHALHISCWLNYFSAPEQRRASSGASRFNEALRLNIKRSEEHLAGFAGPV